MGRGVWLIPDSLSVQMMQVVVMALPKCDYSKVSGTETFDVLQNMCDVFIYYCFVLFGKLAGALTAGCSSSKRISPLNTATTGAGLIVDFCSRSTERTCRGQRRGTGDSILCISVLFICCVWSVRTPS